MSLIEDALRKVQDPITRVQPKPAAESQNAIHPTTEPPAAHSWTTPAPTHTRSTPRHPLNALLIVAVAVFALTIVLVIWGSIWIGRLLGITDPSAHQSHARSVRSSSSTSTQLFADPSADMEPRQMPFTLSGIVEGGEPYAVINGKVVGIGEQIEGATVAEVANGSVTLRRQDGSELQLRVSR
ncbi:MAG: hypothetical protein HY352_01360 [Candidatus Omnitrophica bacterium]|nr:hypothetical protein [Candidatus Omnitrophota bacterium]